MQATEIDAALQALLQRAYPSQGLGAPRLLQAGRHRVYELTRVGGPAIARVSLDADAVERWQRHAAVSRALEARGLEAERLVPACDGRDVVQDGRGLVVTLSTRLPGRPGTFTPTSYATLGDALGTWHRTLAIDDVPPGRLHEIRADTLLEASAAAVGQHLAMDLPGGVSAGRLPEIRRRWRDCEQFLSPSVDSLDHTEHGLGHGDAHPLNLIVLRGPGCLRGAWIDLEDAYAGPPLYDLATLVWSTLRETHTQHLWREGLAAYDRQRPLASGALAELGRWVALRHLWWLALHARAWGRFPLHRHQPQFFDAGIELLEAICEDACGARLGALSGRSARGGS